jgi:hypothetical protein
MQDLFTGEAEVEASFRRGYEHGAIETFHAVERFLDPIARETLRAWIYEDVGRWRTQGTLRYPTNWRIRMLAASRTSTRVSDQSASVSPHAGEGVSLPVRA